MKSAHADTLGEESLNLLLSFKPGLTGPASIKFLAEDDALAGYPNAKALYLTYVLPAKADCQLKYIRDYSLLLDIKLIIQTSHDIFSPKAYAVSREMVRSLLPPS